MSDCCEGIGFHKHDCQSNEAKYTKEVLQHAVTKFELAKMLDAAEMVLSNHNTNQTIVYGADTSCDCPCCEILRDALNTVSRVSRAKA
jgi:hypothetical protein